MAPPAPARSMSAMAAAWLLPTTFCRSARALSTSATAARSTRSTPTAGCTPGSSLTGNGSTSAEGGWDFELDAITLTPYVALAYARLSTDAGVQAGGSAALAIDASKDEMWTTTAGLRAGWDISGGLQDGAQLEAGWPGRLQVANCVPIPVTVSWPAAPPSSSIACRWRVTSALPSWACRSTPPATAACGYLGSVVPAVASARWGHS
ncbi:hypothetical protein XpopCFBP1817_04540 [Xanthomonas populi]|uniref:Autotransporter domain-containing protein n=1 Tax=Xanthomonas populi TaxID=53414 RepID=A0A2S7EYF2_9XANT|nr:hypothetical protein XpopCFBP1817_04540 [Xanthomonas populi]